MDPFRGISVTLALVIGLGVARILSASVNVFKSRSHARLDWIPLVWAACIFLWQIQFWWAIIELPTLVSTWTLPEFMLLLSMTLMLYVAAALVLPASEIIAGETLSDTFQRDGRWSLIFLSAYFMLAIFVNVYLFGVPLLQYPSILDAGLVLIPLVFLACSSRKARARITLFYVAFALWSAWANSPQSYPTS
jgi:hypothetical protein